MGEHQCPLCGHITTGFEQQDWELRERADAYAEELQKIFDASQAVWAKMEAGTVGSEEWNGLRAKHSELATLYKITRQRGVAAIS